MEKQETATELNYDELKESEDIDNGFENIDHSLIQQPLQTGLQNVLQILKCMKHGTTEVRHLILRGCNIIYECKICNSLYRSLANFLLHKRFYCKNEMQELLSNNATQKTSSSTVIHPKSLSDEHKCDIETDMKSNDMSVKCFSNIHNIIKSECSEHVEENDVDNECKDIPFEDNLSEKRKNIKCKQSISTVKRKEINNVHILSDNSKCTSFPSMRSRAIRLSRRTDCNLTTLMCLKCDTKYTSIKTLYFHMITKHSAKRQYYPCPYCDNSFVQIWGVTRHLTQVHNKTKEEVNKLKETIKSNAFTKKEFMNSKHTANKGSRIKSYHSFKGNEVCKQDRELNQNSSRLNHSKCCNKTKINYTKIKENVSIRFAASSVIEKKVKSMIDAKKLICLKCRRKFSTFSNLRRHAAIHAGWTRYMCQKCCYQSYNRSDCRTHIQRMHASPEINDTDKFIVSLPSVKISVTKGESLNEYPVKCKKRCKKANEKNLVPQKSVAKNSGNFLKKYSKWNGFKNIDNQFESLVTRSRKYPKIQTYIKDDQESELRSEHKQT